MKVKRVNFHNFLGIEFYYSESNDMKVSIKDYIRNFINEIPYYLRGTCVKTNI